MDFEEFRKKKKAQKEEAKRQEQRMQEPAASGKKLDWVEGFGPAGPKNPKVKGFMLGRYGKVRVDPNELKKPKGYEAQYAKPDDSKSKAEIELERRKAALAKAEAELEKAEEKAELAEIEQRRKEMGAKKIKKQRW